MNKGIKYSDLNLDNFGSRMLVEDDSREAYIERINSIPSVEGKLAALMSSQYEIATWSVIEEFIQSGRQRLIWIASESEQKVWLNNSQFRAWLDLLFDHVAVHSNEKYDKVHIFAPYQIAGKNYRMLDFVIEHSEPYSDGVIFTDVNWPRRLDKEIFISASTGTELY